MNRLFWIVCEDQNATLFEGRYQGRTRGAAIKYLKASLGRTSLKGLVFTITEIPVPLIREIVAEMLSFQRDHIGAAAVISLNHQVTHPSTDREDVLAANSGMPATSSVTSTARTLPSTPSRNSTRKVGNPGLGDDFWEKVHAFWNECRSIKMAAMKFGISQNSVKTRARREGWRNTHQ